MKLITKYKIFENKTITKENIEELVDNYLVNDKFILFLKEKGINFNYSREIQFDSYINNDINIVIFYYDNNENMRLRVDIGKFKGNDVVECKFSFRYDYNNYRLYDYYSELDFVKKNFDMYDNLKEIFINTNNHMISIPFIGTKKEVDDLESFEEKREIVKQLFGDVGELKKDFTCAVESSILLHGDSLFVLF